MKLSEYHFFAKEIKYLGHILSATGIKPLPSRMETIPVKWPPKNAKQVQAFLGFVGYYQTFIKKFDHIEKPSMTHIQHDANFPGETNPSNSIHPPKRNTLTVTHMLPPRPLKVLHSMHRCVGWCLQSSTVPQTWWSGIACCLPLTHVHIHSMQMGASQNRKLMGYIMP